MKKFIFAFVCVAAMAACGSKSANEVINPTAIDSTAVDSTVVDSTVVDTLVIDSVAVDTLQ